MYIQPVTIVLSNLSQAFLPLKIPLRFFTWTPVELESFFSWYSLCQANLRIAEMEIFLRRIRYVDTSTH